MSEQLLTILKFGLLALLYLFFFRVLRMVWLQTREAPVGAGGPPVAAAPAPGPARRRGLRRKVPPSHLVALEPPEIADATYVLVPEMTVGRSDGATIAIEDSFISSVHCRVFGQNSEWMVEDLGSTNGTYLNDKKVTAPTVLSTGDVLRVGGASFEAR